MFVFACGITLSSIMVSAQEDSGIPAWIKNNAGWWADGTIDDPTYVSGIEYLIEIGIIKMAESNNQAVNDELVEENVRLASSLDEFAANEEILNDEIDSLKTQLQASQIANNAFGNPLYADGWSSVQNFQDNGDFYLTYEPSEYFQEYEDWLKAEQYFEVQVAWLNTLFKLPYDVDVIVGECGVSNAFYYAEEKTIVICYEYISETDWKFGDYFDRWYGVDEWLIEDLNSSVLNKIDHTFYHEVGHALRDIYQLPTTGLEENVADQFGAYIILEFSEGTIGQDAMSDAAIDYWMAAEENPNLTITAFADTHGLNQQRFFDLACYTYGSDPNYNQYMIEAGWLPENRLGWCSSEYYQIVYSLDTLLLPYFQPGVVG